jgi:hypothetical protein
LEYVQANFNHSGKRLHKKKIRVKKIKSTGKERKIDVGRKEVQDANNARNRDAFSITKSNNILEYYNRASEGRKNLEDILSNSSNPNEVEDFLITLIDLKKTDKL